MTLLWCEVRGLRLARASIVFGGDMGRGCHARHGQEWTQRRDVFGDKARELWMPNHEPRQGRGRFRGGSGGLIEERADMGRERDVPIQDRDVVGDAQNEARCLGMFRDKEREARVCGHEPGETRMRVLEGRCSCNYRKPARCVLHKQRAGHFPLRGGGGPSLSSSCSSRSLWRRSASISWAMRFASSCSLM